MKKRKEYLADALAQNRIQHTNSMVNHTNQHQNENKVSNMYEQNSAPTTKAFHNSKSEKSCVLARVIYAINNTKKIFILFYTILTCDLLGQVTHTGHPTRVPAILLEIIHFCIHSANGYNTSTTTFACFTSFSVKTNKEKNFVLSID
ncbi:hypothetical protein C2G38_2047683 [Gigaspora rosea]|uniref:Uncharacterized protein n=1 Tax=Gigaspora rosea TaxID=44941 RepID=A0A397UD83_9GLOM|nr:hypothetical protein C2G38_2047683 [Gigaspora rosea]